MRRGGADAEEQEEEKVWIAPGHPRRTPFSPSVCAWLDCVEQTRQKLNKSEYPAGSCPCLAVATCARVLHEKNANLQRKLSLFMRALGTDGLNFPAFERLKLVDDFLDVLRAVKRVLLSTSADGC